MELSLKRYARVAALGAFGVSAAVLALYALIAFGARYTPTGGIDHIEAAVTWISVAVPVAAIIAAHIAYARILLDYGKRP